MKFKYKSLEIKKEIINNKGATAYLSSFIKGWVYAVWI